MKIAHLHIENNVFLAPMAGVTDAPFRVLCKEMGCGFTVTEMVSARALYHGSRNTQELLHIAPGEMPAAAQIFGSEPEIMAEVVEIHLNHREDIAFIDINMGCPVPKIVKNGEGSALMKNAPLAEAIVSAIKKVSSKPVTVKIRKGFTEDSVNAVEFSKVLEAAGADAITVHGRTREQMYQGKADWDIIAKVKKALKIPVIGNGDVFSGEDAIKLFQTSGCDGIMIARGCEGNPWIFSEINSALKKEKWNKPCQSERIDLCIRHYNLALEYHGEEKALREMRKHINWYIKGMENSINMKNIINQEKSPERVIEILSEYKETLTCT